MTNDRGPREGAERRPGLGRLHAPDLRDLHFPLRAALPRRVPARSRFWRTGPVLDQGAESSCVGHAWRSFLDSAPIMTRSGIPPAELYRQAQKIDEWEGEDYDGTSVRAGVKVLESLGHIAQYLWGANASDARDYVVTRGPVVFGTWWREDMFEPDRRGYISVSGGDAGGHAYAIVGYSLSRQAFRIQNSWGRGWGKNGRAWLRYDDAESLIRDEGEVCSAIERRIVATP